MGPSLQATQYRVGEGSGVPDEPPGHLVYDVAFMSSIYRFITS